MRDLLIFSGFVCLILIWQLLLHAQPSQNNSSSVGQLLQRAADLMQRGELKPAEAELRKAVDLAPRDAAALSMLGGVLGMQGRLEESSQFFKKALQLDPGNRDARRNLAVNQIQARRTSAAIGNLEVLLKTDPGDREAILMLGFAWEVAGNFARAVLYLEQVPDLVGQHPDHIAALVRSYYRTGQKEKARRRLVELQNSSADPASIYLGGQIAMEAEDWEAAEKLFTAAKTGFPKPHLINYQLARIRYQTGRYRESKDLLEPIANSSASDGAVLNVLAWCYLKEGDEATGVKILTFAIDRFPAEAANFVDLGRLYMKGNRLDTALDVVRRGAALHSESGPLFELKGELESKEGLHAPAVQSYRQAVHLNPRSPEALLGLALAQTNLLQHKDAIATFEKGLRDFPDDARFYAEYGKVLLLPWASGENPGAATRAEQLLKRAVKLDGSLAGARFELGNELVKTGRAAEAIPHLEKAASLDPGNPQVHFVLGRAYRTLGRTQDADRESRLFEKLR
jgi:tetratricopeptide (TPR) repeat protein